MARVRKYSTKAPSSGATAARQPAKSAPAPKSAAKPSQQAQVTQPAKRQRLSRRVVEESSSSEDELQQDSDVGRDPNRARAHDDDDDDDDLEDFASTLRDEAAEACERVEIKSFLKIWLFIVENMAKDSMDLVHDTVSWLDNEGATAPARDVRNKWRSCHAAMREGTRVRKRKWVRLLDETDRHWHVSPRRLLREVGLRAERSLGFSPLGPEHPTPFVEEEDDDGEYEEGGTEDSPLAARAKKQKGRAGGKK